MKKNILKKFLILIVIMISVNLLPGISDRPEPLSSLKGYLLQAAENNPALKAAFSQWKAEIERIAQVSSLPDPDFTLAYFINEVETKVGPQQMRVGFIQKFPWFGKLKLQGVKVLERSQALKENFERLKLELFYKVKNLYYDYYFNLRSIQIIRKNITLLSAASEQVRSMYSTGTTSYSNLIRIQIELERLKNRYKSLEDKLPTIRFALNAVLNRAPEQEVLVEKNIGDLGVKLQDSHLSQILKTTNPELKIVDHLVLSREAGLKLAKMSFFPDISFGADVIITGDSSVPGVTDSGKDPFLLKLSFNVPIKINKIKASIREAKINLDAVKYDRIEKENNLIATLETALFNFNDSGRIVKLYLDSLIPKAQQVFEVTKTAFSTGKTEFLYFIDSQRTLLEFELILEKAKSSHHQNLALIEKIIGKDLEYLKSEQNESMEKP